MTLRAAFPSFAANMLFFSLFTSLFTLCVVAGPIYNPYYNSKSSLGGHGTFTLRGRSVDIFEIERAQGIVRDAQARVAKRNARIIENAKKRIPDAPHLKPRFVDDELYAFNETVANASALVSEYLAKHGKIDRSGYRALKKRQGGGFWMESVEHGFSSFNPDSSYKVFRNVKDFGAVGDGVTDDTAAINRAISEGNRCDDKCGSSTTTGAIVYFPPGTYLVSGTLLMYYNTQIIGNPNDRATILASPSFVGLGVLSSNKYIDGADGSQWYINQSNFMRQVRNLIVDIRNVPNINPAAIHWQVAQATSLQNIDILASEAPDNDHNGIFMENGSGGFFSDVNFQGGAFGMYCGAQQFTAMRLNFKNCKTAINIHWNWGWTWKSVTIDGSDVGFNLVTPGGTQATGSALVMDSKISNTATAFLINEPKPDGADVAGSVYLTIDNVQLENAPAGVKVEGGETLLEGGSKTITSWASGKIFTDGTGNAIRGGDITPQRTIPDSLLGEDGFLERPKPQYEDRPASDFFSVKQAGAKGDGKSDDTAAIQNAINQQVGKGIVYFPAGSYIVTSTVTVPKGSILVGELWSQIMGSGAAFSDINKPTAIVKVGEEGDVGSVEITDLMITVQGATAGAVLMEWNIRGEKPGDAAMWDTHFRVGGAAGSQLQVQDCPKLTGSVNPKCIAASMLMHVKTGSSGYFENIWAWVADHDLDILEQTQIDIYTARGILIEGDGPHWLYGTASEHCVLYQYSLQNASNVFMGMIQTESPYFQETPKAPEPFTSVLGQFTGDPDFKDCDPNDRRCAFSWGVLINKSKDIFVYGAGLYSWFQEYEQTCLETMDCQKKMVQILESTAIWVYNMATVGVLEMLSGPTVIEAEPNRNSYASTFNAWLGQAA